MNAETAEKVALLVLHGAEPYRYKHSTLWRITLVGGKGIFAHPNGLRAWRPAVNGDINYVVLATWDDMVDALAYLSWAMIHEFLGTTP
jgi:hypothetical protein